MAKGAKGERCKNEENSPDLDQYAKDALDELFSKEQQTYEEFLEGFTFLKKGEEVKFDLMERKPCTSQEISKFFGKAVSYRLVKSLFGECCKSCFHLALIQKLLF